MRDPVRDQPASEKKVGEIVFPPEWLLGRRWLFTEILMHKELPDGLAIIGGGVLDDGTNLLGMVYPGGQRLLRSAPPDWSKETRKTGNERPDLDKDWGRVLEAMIQGHAEAAREIRASRV